MDRTYTLMLKFERNEEFPEGLSLTISGIVRHKVHDEYNRSTRIGIEFDSVTEENQQTLERLVVFLEKANQFWGF